MSDSPKPEKLFLSGTSYIIHISKASGLSEERKPRGSPEMQYSFRPDKVRSLFTIVLIRGY